MTFENIMKVGLRHFALNGYEGTSLADIASEVGIKKSSIYNHFKGKDDLFIRIYHDAANNEIQFVESYLKPDKYDSIEKQLVEFLVSYKERFVNELNTKFFLRMAFYPPKHLQIESTNFSLSYFNQMKERAQVLFQIAKDTNLMHSEVTVNQATTAYMAILDSLFVELLYSNLNDAMSRIHATWYIFWRGIKNI